MTILSPSFLVLDDLDDQVNIDKIHEGQISKTAGILTHKPLLSLPYSHSVLDAIFSDLPNLLATYKERDAIESIPLLDYTSEGLRDKFLSRAAAIISNLAHAYYYNNPCLKDRLPKSIYIAFKKICTRLGRKSMYRGMFDAFYYNWRYIDSSSMASTMNLDFETAELLLPVFGGETERVFHLSVILSEHYFAKALLPITLAQNSILNNDDLGLLEQLERISDVINNITSRVLMKVSFNSMNNYYMNPIYWGRTFAVIAQPRFKGEIGLSGVASPMFHILDNFIGRKKYNTNMGQQLKAKYKFMPLSIVQFIKSLSEVSLTEYIQKKQNNKLQHAYKKLLDIYLGSQGWLGLHKRKVFGAMQLVFKAGRLLTNGGEQGELVGNKGVKNLDYDLGKAIEERKIFSDSYSSVTRIKASKLSDISTVLELDITGLGFDLLPGDKILLLPKNINEDINKILKLLTINKNTLILLNSSWKNELSKRGINSELIDLENLIRFMEICNISDLISENIKNFFNFFDNTSNKNTFGYDLYLLLALMKNNGKNIDTFFLKKSKHGYNLICDLIPPVIPRYYSVSFIKNDKDRSFIQLSIKNLEYSVTISNNSRKIQEFEQKGLICKSLLNRNRKKSEVFISHIPSFYFRMESEKCDKIIMFAAGIGISPFISFLEARKRSKGHGSIVHNILFYSIKSLKEFHHKDYLLNLVRKGHLLLFLNITSSQEKVQRYRMKNLIVDYGRIINNSLKDKLNINFSNNFSIRHYYFYACGSSGYIRTVMDILKNTLGGNGRLNKLIMQKKVCIEVFNSRTENKKLSLIDYSVLCTKNNKSVGYWISIEGLVYDISKYIDIHPGGEKILRSISGMVADYHYRRVHTRNSEADGWLSMYLLGRLNNYDNAILYIEWFKTLNSIVEIQNTYYNNTDFTKEIKEPSYLTFFNYENFTKFHLPYIENLIMSLYKFYIKKFQVFQVESDISYFINSFDLNISRKFETLENLNLFKNRQSNIDLFEKMYSNANNQIISCIDDIKLNLLRGIIYIEDYIKSTRDLNCKCICKEKLTRVIITVMSSIMKQKSILSNFKQEYF